jgi:hypothetical protein
MAWSVFLFQGAHIILGTCDVPFFSMQPRRNISAFSSTILDMMINACKAAALGTFLYWTCGMTVVSPLVHQCLNLVVTWQRSPWTWWMYARHFFSISIVVGLFFAQLIAVFLWQCTGHFCDVWITQVWIKKELCNYNMFISGRFLSFVVT